ncbi:MAG: adenylate/guanylate cyclase domain-containing protein [Alphaproteobacteria bacterium]|nr:adenylate/guanylate cyclase domain-containing protein [Alphaproteobacteria bacterium]
MTDTSSQVQQSRPVGVRGNRRYKRPEPARPKNASFDSIRQWLRGPAHAVGSPIKLVDGLCWRMVAAGLPIDRAGITVALLHPEFSGYGIRWWHDIGESEEALVEHEVTLSDVYRASPFPPVVERGETIRVRIEPRANSYPYPVVADLAAQGYTDYIVQPVRLQGFSPTNERRRFQACNWATKRAGGFSDADIAALGKIADDLAAPLALVTERRIARDLLSVYLGRSIGSRVLSGEIRRGFGDPIRAAILATDMRGFTALNDRLPAGRIIALLNGWFERQVAAVHTHGGEVLKFVGDGMLAIFPIEDVEFARMAARQALAAAREAIEAAYAMDADPAFADAAPLRAVAALHTGEVFHGNIGAPDRLDFTAIGPSVNVVTRLESLAKSLDRELIVSAAFAEICPEPLVSLGRHALKGVAEPVEAFTCPSVPVRR